MTPEIEVGAWRKSTRSGGGGGSNCIEVGAWRTSARSSGSGSGSNCVEVGAWHISSHSSGGAGSNCVEAGACSHGIAIRDTKDRTGPVLTLSPSNWAGFLASLR